jgi:SAM-dependent methyltransferase
VRAEPDELPELMDEACSYEEFRACLRDLERANKLTLAYRPTLKFIEDAARRHRSVTPLCIVDVGCGGGDMLRRIARWAEQERLPVRLTGIDLNPYSRRYVEEIEKKEARRGHGSGARIEWITGDAFTYVPAAPIDVVLSSLFTHHLPTSEVVRFVSWMEQSTQGGWFINDLHRARGSYIGFWWLSRAAGWHRFVKHDGPVSIRRAFREDDWRQIAVAAGLPPSAVCLEHWRPGRLCVRRMK